MARAPQQAPAQGGAERSEPVSLVPPEAAAVELPPRRPDPPRPDWAGLRRRLGQAELSGYALLGPDAVRHPSQAAARAAADPPAGPLQIDTARLAGRYPSRRLGVEPVAILADRGPVLRVRGMRRQQRSGHCHGGAADPRFRLETWVRRADLVPLLGRRVERRFADGTGFALAPGLAVAVPAFARKGGWAVAAAGVALELELPAAAIALAYPGPQPFEHERPRYGWARQARSPLLGRAHRSRPNSFVADRARLVLDGELIGRADQLSQQLALAQNGQADPVQLATACLKLTLRLEPAVFSEHKPGAGGLGTIGGGGSRRRRPPRPAYRVAPGTPVFWPDGRPAGELLLRLELDKRPDAGGRRCLEASGVAVPVCIRAADIQKRESAGAER